MVPAARRGRGGRRRQWQWEVRAGTGTGHLHRGRGHRKFRCGVRGTELAAADFLRSLDQRWLRLLTRTRRVPPLWPLVRNTT